MVVKNLVFVVILPSFAIGTNSRTIALLARLVGLCHRLPSELKAGVSGS